MQSIEGYSVLITGGGSGLGRGVAEFMAARGAKVTITGRRAEKLAEVATAIGPNCAVSVGDVSIEADRWRMIEAAVAHGGGLDGLVNNAGNMLRGPIAPLDDERLSRASVNFDAFMRIRSYPSREIVAEQSSFERSSLRGSDHGRSWL